MPHIYLVHARSAVDSTGSAVWSTTFGSAMSMFPLLLSLRKQNVYTPFRERREADPAIRNTGKW